jgi:pyrimidine-nucleoside phosphorylase
MSMNKHDRGTNMRFYDIIQNKRDGAELSEEEIRFAVKGFTAGEIPDYQMSAFLMAVFLNGMSNGELAVLTDAMMKSGEVVDLSMFGALSVDKHSTGGVGDKTTLIVAPIVAALGGKVAKMSGRGLGHTGGTVDKLEAIPGFKTTLSQADFLRQVGEIGIAVIGASGDLAPADKKIYALRDVTATIDSIPLIASSIMSKKLASGAMSIVLDVKSGSGAFMKSVDAAKELARTMVEIGKAAGRKMTAVITNMDIPLGHAVGNALEVEEAAAVLAGKGPDDLWQVCRTLASRMLCLCHGWSEAESETQVDKAIADGTAIAKFAEWIERQGGNAGFIGKPGALGVSPVQFDYKAASDGYITAMDAELIGKAASALGAGREKAGDKIDFQAGIMIRRKTGDFCHAGDTIAELHTSGEALLTEARRYLDHAISFGSTEPEKQPLIYGIVG